MPALRCVDGGVGLPALRVVDGGVGMLPLHRLFSSSYPERYPDLLVCTRA